MKTLLGIDPNSKKFDKTKYVLQCRAVVSWMNFFRTDESGKKYNHARGTVILPTGIIKFNVKYFILQLHGRNKKM